MARTKVQRPTAPNAVEAIKSELQELTAKWEREGDTRPHASDAVTTPAQRLVDMRWEFASNLKREREAAGLTQSGLRERRLFLMAL